MMQRKTSPEVFGLLEKQRMDLIALLVVTDSHRLLTPCLGRRDYILLAEMPVMGMV